MDENVKGALECLETIDGHLQVMAHHLDDEHMPAEVAQHIAYGEAAHLMFSRLRISHSMMAAAAKAIRMLLEDRPDMINGEEIPLAGPNDMAEPKLPAPDPKKDVPIEERHYNEAMDRTLVAQGLLRPGDVPKGAQFTAMMDRFAEEHENERMELDKMKYGRDDDQT